MSIKIDPELQAFLDEAKTPYLTAITYAGWKLWNCGQSAMQDDYWFDWIAANRLSGIIVEFSTSNDEPEADYEDAAFTLVVKGHCKEKK